MADIIGMMRYLILLGLAVAACADDASFVKNRMAAENGDATAMLAVAEAYLFGDGVKADQKEALKWAKASAEAGNGRAMWRLGDFYQIGIGGAQDHTEALKWYRAGAKAGDGAAMAGVGWMYFHGYGVEKDVKEAIAWYRKSAEAGSGEGMNNLGHMYRSGEGVEKDAKVALEWFERGAAKGNAWAMDNAAEMYVQGEGTKRNDAKGREWLEKAVAAGHPPSAERLAQLYMGAREHPVDFELARKWAMKAGEMGSPMGWRLMGYMHLKGMGVKADQKEALKWYQRAADAGDPDAVADVARIKAAVGQEAAADQKGPIVFIAPAHWKKAEPGMMLAKYQAGEVVISVSMLPTGIELLAPNVNRWRAQLGLAAQKDEEVLKSLKEVKVGGEAGYAVDLIGDKVPVQRTVGVIVVRGNKSAFFKMIGPAKAVEAEKKAFDAAVAAAKIREEN